MTPESRDVRDLIEEGAGLTDRFLRAGPGTPAARPHLDRAIDVLESAYRRLDAGQMLRGGLAGQLGWLYGVRHLAHGGDRGDRVTAMRLLEESLASPQPQAVIAGGSKLVLGQLLLAGMTARMSSPGAMTDLMAGRGRPDGARDADRAIALFREVAEGPPVSPQLTSAARTLLTVAEALRGMAGGPGGMDFGGLARAMSAMQDFQRQTAGGGTGMVPPPVPDLSALLGPAVTRPFDEHDEPIVVPAPARVAVVDGPVPGGGPPPRPRPAPIAAAPAAELRALLPGDPVALLESPDPAGVDERVALAAAAAEAPGAEPADHLALAAALIARHRADGGSGWPGGPDDLRIAAGCLARIAPDLPGMAPGQVAAAVRVDAALPGPGRLDEAFTEVTAALRKSGIAALVFGPAVLHAGTGRLEPADPDRAWTGRIAALVPVAGDAVVSHVRSAGQLVALVRRGRRPVAGDPVFVANPRRDRDGATVDALRLRRAFHPRSTGLGTTVEQCDGAGTPAEVAARLDASLLHLGCGVTPSGDLELAGPALLTAAEIAGTAAPAGPGGVAILPPDPGALTGLGAALLARGYAAVIGFTAPLPERVASLVYWMLHAALVDDGVGPAGAVAAARAWLADPERAVPGLLAAEYASVTADLDLRDPAYARALVCHGL
ncbi:hypothetical protein [Actinoplanes sp. NPDC051851]|uniref:hypothetical protein n=1 Tax=Actinoplanes sp. NPDC051851 TaxID=3154753 RepID=UPI003422498A